jgi:hypothetical protein
MITGIVTKGKNGKTDLNSKENQKHSLIFLQEIYAVDELD